MKILIIALLSTLSFNLFGQGEVAGQYRNYFFCEIQLNADSTFDYGWYNDLHGRWAKGAWTSKEDTVYFHVIPMYDTLSITKSNGMTADTLILSQYSKPRRLTPQILAEITINSIEQNATWLSGKLVFKENKLYEIKDGKLMTEKQEGSRRRMLDPWYFKSDE